MSPLLFVQVLRLQMTVRSLSHMLNLVRWFRLGVQILETLLFVNFSTVAGASRAQRGGERVGGRRVFGVQRRYRRPAV